MSRISEQTGGLKYSVLDDIVGSLCPEILQSNPIVENLVKDMANSGHRNENILSNLDLFKI